MEAQLLKQMAEDMSFIKKEIITIKKHMVDIDVVLTDDDLDSLQEAERDLLEGKTKKLN